MATPTASTFVPPSPGSWELERVHLTRPISGFGAPIFPVAMPRGFAESLRNYGALLETFELAIINRFVYMCPRPVGAPKTAKGVPPRPVFAVLRRVHPEIRKRIKRAETVFRDRIWRDELKWWDEEVKPGLLAEARTLRQERIAEMSAADLAAHVRRAAAFLDRANTAHHRFNMCAMVPLGDFLAHTVTWTGMDPGEILQVFRGRSAPSAGAVAELSALRQALAADADARALLESTRPAAAILDTLEARTDAVGAAVRAYLDEVGLRCMGGYDVAERHAREVPELLVSVMRTALTEGRESDHRQAAERATTAVRARVPAAHQATFDELLHEAQLTYRVRDERNFFGDSLATGLARRAILEAGRRLAAAGRVADAEHLIDATADEIVALLEGKGPSAAELAERTRYRNETPIDSAPARLGFPPSAPPPADWLPPAAARLQRAIDAALGLMFAAKEHQASAKQLKGFAASPGVYEGPARVVRDASELPSVRSGDVLVTGSTAPTFNVVLPLIGAIVTERGGALSHAAIVAREYGLPAVVGCAGAMKAVRTGQQVRVDGGNGTVSILE